jgi:hypothetical protein
MEEARTTTTTATITVPYMSNEKYKARGEIKEVRST